MNSGCPHCAGNFPIQEDAYRELANLRGFKFVGEHNGNTRVRVKWECDEGHQFDATYHDIRRGGGCPVCSHRVVKDSEDYHTLASLLELVWLGQW